MKEMIGNACNIAAIPSKTGVIASLEIIIVTSEPKYVIDEAGELRMSRTTDALRVMTSSKGCRELAKVLNQLADDADELVKLACTIECAKTTVSEGK